MSLDDKQGQGKAQNYTSFNYYSLIQHKTQAFLSIIITIPALNNYIWILSQTRLKKTNHRQTNLHQNQSQHTHIKHHHRSSEHQIWSISKSRFKHNKRHNFGTDPEFKTIKPIQKHGQITDLGLKTQKGIKSSNRDESEKLRTIETRLWRWEPYLRLQWRERELGLWPFWKKWNESKERRDLRRRRVKEWV